ncbi:MAG: TIGR02147 family protein [Bacteriovoracaceae bacterium]
MQEQIAVQHLLRSHLLEIQSKNSKYSLRSYAGKVGVHVGALSSIINGKRNVSRSLAERITRKLLLDPQKRSEILSLFPDKKVKKMATASNQSRYMQLEASQFKMIAEWEHYAVLSLMNCNDFKNDSEWISNRLGITPSRAQDVMERLIELELIKKEKNGKLMRTHSAMRTSDDTISLSLRKSHEVTLELAKDSLHRDGVEKRDFTYITMAINPKKISEAKERIRKFQDDLCDLLESGERTEVYRFSSQLIPLTKLKQ